MPSPKQQCAIFLTHVWTPPIARHFEKLKREASPYVDVFLAYQASGPVPAGVPADIVIDDATSRNLMPRRYAECEARGEGIYNFVDLVFMAAFNDPAVAAYEHYWYVEMDVDFSGDWGTFFSQAVGYEGDLLAQSIVTRDMVADFYHWPWYRQPAELTVEPLRALMCIARFSRPMVDLIVHEHNTRDWAGIFELTHPTIALAHGMKFAQLGGVGPFTPPERRDRHYTPSERTFTFRPPRGYTYFCDAPRRFRYPDRLYHPVKVGWPLSKRIDSVWQSALGRWDRHSPFLSRLIRAVGLIS